MTPLEETQVALAEAQSVLGSLVAEQHRMLLAGTPVPIAYAHKLHAARSKVKSMERLVRHLKGSDVEVIDSPLLNSGGGSRFCSCRAPRRAAKMLGL